MTTDEIENVLTEAAKLKMPRFGYRDNKTSPREKIERLEEYLLDTARWRGHLEQARLHAKDAVRELERKWDHLAGWEPNRRQGEKSVQSIEDAKKLTNPDLFDSIKTGRELVKKLGDQIRRLEHDDEVASRAYTLIVGPS